MFCFADFDLGILKIHDVLGSLSHQQKSIWKAQTSTKTTDPAKFLLLAISCSGKNSV